MPSYSSHIKESMVIKLCSPGGPSALQLSKDTGISQTALSRWKKQFGNRSKVKTRRPEDWSHQVRLLAVFESQGLDEEQLGVFLRKNGLHSSRLVDWKTEALSEAAKKRLVAAPEGSRVGRG
jgi:transposase-like protein